jgi:hypothetical protein
LGESPALAKTPATKTTTRLAVIVLNFTGALLVVPVTINEKQFFPSD